MAITVRYFAGARAAAGLGSEQIALTGTATIEDLLARLTDLHGGRLADVLPACSFLVDGRAVHSHAEVLPEDAEFDVLPPFAGG